VIVGVVVPALPLLTHLGPQRCSVIESRVAVGQVLLLIVVELIGRPMHR